MFSIKTHPTSPYSTEQIYEKSCVGFADKFKPKYRGLGNMKLCALSMAERIKRNIDNRDKEWLEEVEFDRKSLTQK